MTADALSAPLGRDKQSKRRFELVISMPQLVLGGVGLLVVAVGAWATIEPRPLIARLLTPAPVDGSSAQAGKKTESPSLVARPEAPTVAPFQPESTPAEPVRSLAQPMKTITIIDGSSGKRQEIVIPETAEKNTELSEPAEPSRLTRNPGRPLPRPPR